MINLTIQGTDRSIEIINIGTNSIISKVNTSEYSLIPYDNYLVKLTEIQSNITVNSIQLTQNKLLNDVVLLFILGSIVVCSIYFFKYSKKLWLKNITLLLE